MRCVGSHGKKVAGRSNPTWMHESRSHRHVTTDVTSEACSPYACNNTWLLSLPSHSSCAVCSGNNGLQTFIGGREGGRCDGKRRTTTVSETVGKKSCNSPHFLLVWPIPPLQIPPSTLAPHKLQCYTPLLARPADKFRGWQLA